MSALRISLFIIFISSFINSCLVKNAVYSGWYKDYGINKQDELNDISNLPRIIKALKNKNYYIRLLAIKEIQKFGSKASSAGPFLRDLLVHDSVEEVTIRSTLALGKIKFKDQQTMDIIIRNLLSHTNVYVRNASAIALGEIGLKSPGVMDALKSASKFDQFLIVKKSANKSYSILTLKKEEYGLETLPNLKKIQNAQIYIALTDLDAINVNRNLSLALTNRLIAELHLTGSFVVLERQKMSDILAEQGFQLSGCTDTECVVEMGKLLNVQQMLTGSIAKVGTIFSLNLRLIDVETGKLTSSAIEDMNGGIEKVLTRGIRNSVNKLISNYHSE